MLGVAGMKISLTVISIEVTSRPADQSQPTSQGTRRPARSVGDPGRSAN